MFGRWCLIHYRQRGPTLDETVAALWGELHTTILQHSKRLCDTLDPIRDVSSPISRTDRSELQNFALDRSEVVCTGGVRVPRKTACSYLPQTAVVATVAPHDGLQGLRALLTQALDIRCTDESPEMWREDTAQTRSSCVIGRRKVPHQLPPGSGLWASPEGVQAVSQERDRLHSRVG